MGAAGSKDGDPGIITVVPAATAAAAAAGRGPSPLPHASPGSSRPTSRLSNRSETPTDPLMQHLQELKAQGAKMDPTLFAASPNQHLSTSSSSSRRSTAAAAAAAAAAVPTAAAAADPDSLLADLAVAQQLTIDMAVLNAAITALVTNYQTWHAQHIDALVQNQEYITRTMDQAESKAEKAVRHVQQQTTKLKQLSAGLSKAAQLPSMLQQLTAATEALEQQLAVLEQRADAVTAAAAGGGSTAARNADGGKEPAASSSSNISNDGARVRSLTGGMGSSGSKPGSFRSWLGVGSGSAGSQQQQQQQQQQHENDATQKQSAPGQQQA